MTGQCAFIDAMVNDVSDEDDSFGGICKPIRVKRKISECDDNRGCPDERYPK
jgi:hypothetical protein